jgi:hypothetical protein
MEMPKHFLPTTVMKPGATSKLPEVYVLFDLVI